MIAAFGRLFWFRRNPVPLHGRVVGEVSGLENGWIGWHIGAVELLIGPGERSADHD